MRSLGATAASSVTFLMLMSQALASTVTLSPVKGVHPGSSTQGPGPSAVAGQPGLRPPQGRAWGDILVTDLSGQLGSFGVFSLTLPVSQASFVADAFGKHSVSPDWTHLAHVAFVPGFLFSRPLVLDRSVGSSSVVVSPNLEMVTLLDHPWSADGEHLALTGTPMLGMPTALHLCEIDGSDAVAVVDSTVTFDPDDPCAWAPTDPVFAFAARNTIANRGALYTILSDGSSRTEVSANDGSVNDVISLKWSPDGTWLAYRKGSRLFIVESNGDGLVEVEDDTPGAYYWSADSQALIFERRVLSGTVLLFSASLTGTVTPVTSLVARKASWRVSPDGQEVAFIAQASPANGNELFVVPATGGTSVRVSQALDPLEAVESLEWAPDSERIAYLVDLDLAGDPELFAVDHDGAALVDLSETSAPSSYGPSGQFSWSPDSQRILFVGARVVTTPEVAVLTNDAHGGNVSVQGGPYPPTVLDVRWTRDSDGLVWLHGPAGQTGGLRGSTMDGAEVDVSLLGPTSGLNIPSFDVR